MRNEFHESLSRKEQVEIGANRAFGFVMGGACLIIAGLGYWAGTNHWPYWTIAALAFAGTGWIWPSLLYPLNRAWFLLGLAMHRVVTPVVMGFMFFAVITPTGLLMRLFGQRPLGLKFDPNAASYWTERDGTSQPGPMTKQY